MKLSLLPRICLVTGLLVSTTHSITSAGVIVDRSSFPDLNFELLPTETARLVKQGVTAISKGELGAAETYFRKAIKFSPMDPIPLLGLAQVAIRRNQPEQAELWLTQAERVAPQSAEVQTSWGRYYLSQNEYAKSEAAYKQAIEANPRAVVAYTDLGQLYLNELKRPQAAVEAFQSAIDLQPDSASAHYGMALGLARLNQIDAAIVEFETVARLLPEDPVPLQTLGRFLVTQGQYKQAVNAFTRGVKIKPDLVSLRLDRANSYFASEQVAEAIDEYKTIARLAPNNATPYVRLGMIYESQLKTSDAEAVYRRAIELDPKNPIAYNNLALLFAQENSRLDEALELAKKAVELGEDHPNFVDTLAWIYRAKGNLNKAEMLLDQAIAKSPPSAILYYHLGIVRSERQKNKDALAALRRALEINENFSESNDARRRINDLKSN